MCKDSKNISSNKIRDTGWNKSNAWKILIGYLINNGFSEALEKLINSVNSSFDQSISHGDLQPGAENLISGFFQPILSIKFKPLLCFKNNILYQIQVCVREWERGERERESKIVCIKQNKNIFQIKYSKYNNNLWKGEKNWWRLLTAI